MVKKITITSALEPFLSKPKERLHLAAISKEIREPHPTVRQWLNALEKLGVLKKAFQGRLTLYSLNFENQNLIDYLVIAEKNRLIKRCDEELVLKELVYHLHILLEENTKAVIFGSATDSLKTAGDIDLLVAGKINEKAITNFSKKFNKELHLICVRNLNGVSKSLKIEIIKKHLIIKGSEDIVRWMIW